MSCHVVHLRTQGEALFGKRKRWLTRYQQESLRLGLHPGTFAVFFVRATVESLAGLVDDRLLQVHLIGEKLQRGQRWEQVEAKQFPPSPKYLEAIQHFFLSPNLQLLFDAEHAGAAEVLCSVRKLFFQDHVLSARFLVFLHSSWPIGVNTKTDVDILGSKGLQKNTIPWFG